jgi:HNH endonuclease
VPHGIKGSTPPCRIQGCRSTALARGLCGMHYKRWQVTGNPGPTERHREVAPPECTVPGCPTKPKGHGLCEMHLARQWRNGHPGPAEKRKPRGRCTTPGCDRPHQAKGFCDRHYRQVLHVDPAHVKRQRQAATAESTRTCSKCKQTLPLSDFYQDKGGKAGYRASCKDCRKGYEKTRYETHGEQIRAYQARYRADPEHRQKDRESSARWRAENPERHRETMKAYRTRTENQERAKQRSRAWRIANPERKREHGRRRAALMKKIHRAGSIPVELLNAKLAYWGFRCWIAGPACTVEPEQWDHVKPLSKGGLHLLANLRPACAPCNTSKKARWPFPVARYGPERDLL